MSYKDKHGNKERERSLLVFVGSPLLDITARCEPDTLRTYGLKPDDCVRATESHDALFRKLFDDPESKVDAGGSALNSARIAQWVMGPRGHTAFIGAVGEDEYASRLLHDLKSNNVEPLLVSIPDSPTGICVCLLSSGEVRSMCTRHGASALFTKNHLDEENISTRLEQANSIFVVGYFLAHSPAVAHSLADRCSPSQLFSLSLSAEYICKDFTTDLLKILPKVDILFGNQAEVMAFASSATGKKSLTVEQAACITANFESSRPHPRIVIVTRGPASVIMVKGADSPRQFPVPMIQPIVDSVGCGDALAGAFLAAYTLTKDIVRATNAGIQAATEIAKVFGNALPHGKEITF